MEAKKEKKKGFWASLFSPKPCSCGDSLIVEEDNKPAVACSCGGGEEESENSANTCCCGTVVGEIREIKVLGPGCVKCKATYSVIERIVKENHLDVKLTKVDDIAEMMNYNIMTTPAVVVDEIVRLKGHVPSEAEVKALLGI